MDINIKRENRLKILLWMKRQLLRCSTFYRRETDSTDVYFRTTAITGGDRGV